MRLGFNIVNNSDKSKRVAFFNVENFRANSLVHLTFFKNRVKIGFHNRPHLKQIEAYFFIGMLSKGYRLVFFYNVKADAKTKKPTPFATFKSSCRKNPTGQKQCLKTIYLYFNIKSYIIIGYFLLSIIYALFKIREYNKCLLKPITVGVFYIKGSSKTRQWHLYKSYHNKS